MNSNIRFDQFLDEAGRITQLPKKRSVREAVLEYLIEKFDVDTIYTEPEVNEICSQWHTFDDYFFLRRELIAFELLDRKRDGSQYWRVKKDTSPEKE